jgi:hypothetical protein
MFVSDENLNLHGQDTKNGSKTGETFVAISRYFSLVETHNL